MFQFVSTILLNISTSRARDRERERERKREREREKGRRRDRNCFVPIDLRELRIIDAIAYTWHQYIYSFVDVCINKLL